MALIAIGDIHGCAQTLDFLLKELAPTPNDHLVFIGDYVDRGPDSKGVIDRLIALQETHECTFLRGNHEELMLNFVDNGDYELWAVNGGIATQQSYGAIGDGSTFPPEHLAFLRATQLYLDTPDFFYVHAGLRPEKTVAESIAEGNDQVFLWERSHLQASELAWEKTVVCGHTPVSTALDTEKLINIDTGCCFYTHAHLGRLTAVRLPEREFVTVPFVG